MPGHGNRASAGSKKACPGTGRRHRKTAEGGGEQREQTRGRRRGACECAPGPCSQSTYRRTYRLGNLQLVVGVAAKRVQLAVQLFNAAPLLHVRAHLGRVRVACRSTRCRQCDRDAPSLGQRGGASTGRCLVTSLAEGCFRPHRRRGQLVVLPARNLGKVTATVPNVNRHVEHLRVAETRRAQGQPWSRAF